MLYVFPILCLAVFYESFRFRRKFNVLPQKRELFERKFSFPFYSLFHFIIFSFAALPLCKICMMENSFCLVTSIKKSINIKMKDFRISTSTKWNSFHVSFGFMFATNIWDILVMSNQVNIARGDHYLRDIFINYILCSFMSYICSICYAVSIVWFEFKLF